MNGVLTWMESSALAHLMQESTWLFPTAEILHFLGLSLLMGSLLVVDLRLLGFSRDVALEAVYKFLPISLVGFAINLSTGILFFFNDPFRYYPNIAFRLKMLLLLLAGLNALYFAVATHRGTALSAGGEPVKSIRIVAGLSLGLWTGVIIFGRLIPYVE